MFYVIEVIDNVVRITSGIFSVRMTISEDEDGKLKVHYPSGVYIPSNKFFSMMVSTAINAYLKSKGVNMNGS